MEKVNEKERVDFAEYEQEREDSAELFTTSSFDARTALRREARSSTQKPNRSARTESAQYVRQREKLYKI